MARVRVSAGRALAVLLLSAGVSACGLTASQREAVGGFGKAASAYGETAGAEVVAMRDGTVKMSAALYQLPYKGSDDDVRQGRAKNLSGRFTPERVSLRLRAAQALKDYGDGLQQLLAADRGEEVKKASVSLTDSLKGLPGDISKMSDAEAGALQKFAQSLSGLMVEDMKAQAFKTIVPKAAVQVEALCALFANEFDIRKSELANEYLIAAGDVTARSDEVMQNHPANLTARQVAIPAFHLGGEHTGRINTVLPKVSKAGTDCVKAHRDMVATLANDKVSFDDIKTFSKQVDGLYAATKGFR